MAPRFSALAALLLIVPARQQGAATSSRPMTGKNR